jgi:hypothetical protein
METATEIKKRRPRGMPKGAKDPDRAFEQKWEGQLSQRNHFQKRHALLSAIQRFNYVVPEIRVGVILADPVPDEPPAPDATS